MAHRRWIVLAVLTAAIACRATAWGEDWPTYRHDHRRSGVTNESLPVADLGRAWVFRSPQPPQPAWAGAADVDAFRKQRGLGDARNYDPAFHCIAAGECVYFGSSSDDGVHCLDLKSGKPRWTYTTGGPVRVAPSAADGLVYFGSDDGQAYAVDAVSGELRWKFRPPCSARRVLNDGRLISLWPCRTGVLVDRGTAYFAMSFLPWKPTFICALDAATGVEQGPGRFVRRVEDGLTFEAAMLASETRLILPQGRSSTVVLQRTTGEQVASLAGASTFAVLTPDDAFYSGPFSRDIGLRGTNAANQQNLAWHPFAVAMLVRGKDSYVLSEGGLSANRDTASGQLSWNTALKRAASLVMAGDTLFAGCDGEVVAVDPQSGKIVWRCGVEGRACGLAVANGTLIVSTDEGCIYGFRAGGAPTNSGPETADDRPQTEATPLIEPTPGLSIPLAVEPYLQFVSPREAIVRWQTTVPSPTLFQYTGDGETQRVEDATPRTEHAATMKQLRRNRQYTYQVFAARDQRVGVAFSGNLDTFFNYSAPVLPSGAAPYGPVRNDSPTVEIAKRILDLSRQRNGLCLVFGEGDGRLAWELARQSGLRVIVVEANPQRVRQLRELWQSAGVYGARLSVLQVESLSELPLPESLANLIVDGRLAAGEDPSIDAQSLVQWLHPHEGTLWLGSAAHRERLAAAGDDLEIEKSPDGRWAVARRGALAGAADWSHQYGNASSSGYTGETLAGCRSASDFEVQWIGRPGPRDHADRQTRHPAPLCTAGRLFIQGQERIVTLDAYHGAPLWSLELPGLERYDIPHDAGNWAAGDEFLFVAINDRCWQIAAETGRVVRRLPVLPGAKANAAYQWGYVALADDGLLIGSANLQNANSKGWWGGEFWRDDEVNTNAASDQLFAIDSRTGKTVWQYADGIVPNSSIAIADGKMFFVESRNPKQIADYSGRVMLHENWPDGFLTALDLKSGAKVWEVPLQFQGGQAIFSMAWSEGKLVICSSGGGKYYVYAIDATDGRPLWQQTVDWGGRGHGAQYSRPVIAQGIVFIRPYSIDLATGKLRPERMPGGGCGTYCASRDALFFRSGDITAWSPDTGQLSGFSRLRPGCWLSAIPAGGLLLSPEAGGGCSCGGWMETSIAFAPVEFPPPSLKSRDRNFIDSLSFELFNRVPDSVVRYTLDGTEPGENSRVYRQPITIDRATTIKAAAYFTRKGREPARSTTIAASFVRQFPAPSIPNEVVAFTESLPVELTKPGRTGTIHYTLDGSEPTPSSPSYDGPIVLTGSADMAARTLWSSEGTELASSEIVRQRFDRVVKKLPREASINFQHKGFKIPDGYLVDAGETFRPQPSGCFYGWTRDMRTRLASRGDIQDPLRNTFIHCMADTAWEIEVEPGRYEVMVCVGETFYGQERATIYVEGVEFCKDLQLPRKETREITKVVEIDDGRITLTSHEDNRIQKATRLNHLRLRRVE
jgi:outer membrane protein assembly factor BamB